MKYSISFNSRNGTYEVHENGILIGRFANTVQAQKFIDFLKRIDNGLFKNKNNANKANEVTTHK